jgi:hypothetical protein
MKKIIVLLFFLMIGCVKNVSNTAVFKKYVYSYPTYRGSITTITGSIALYSSSTFEETLFSVNTTDLSDCNMHGEEYNTYAEINASHPSLQSVQALILKQPTIGTNILPVNLSYPGGLNNQGCITIIVDTSAPLSQNDVRLQVNTSKETATSASLGTGSEFCFGQYSGCDLAGSNSTTFVYSIEVPHDSLLVSLTGNISDSALTGGFAASAPPSSLWSIKTDFYIIPRGCGFLGIGKSRLNSNFLANYTPIYSIVLSGSEVVDLQQLVDYPTNILLTSGDCIVTTVSMQGNGAVDAENQVKYILTPR